MGQVLSAFLGGYLCRKLRHHLRSLWSVDLSLVMDVDPVVTELDSALIRLSSLVNSHQATMLSELRDRIFGLEETVKMEGGDAYFEGNSEVLHLRTLRPDEQLAARAVQALQEKVCDDLQALLSAVVSGDKRLAGWYELGDHLADITYGLMTGGQGLPLTERDLNYLYSGLAKLYQREASRVRIFFPVQQKKKALRMSLDLRSTYGGLCEALKDEECWNKPADKNKGEHKLPAAPVQGAGPAVAQAEPARPAPSVILSGQRKPPIGLGKPKPVLTPAQYNVVQALVQAGAGGLSLDELEGKSGHPDARHILERVAAKDDDWRAVIHLAGGPYMRYRIE
jgi:hypothetical protein